MSRVALLPSAYLPSLGGVEEMTRALALQLAVSGDEVEIWTGDGGQDLPRSERLDGLLIRRFGFELPAAALAATARFSIAGTRAFSQLNQAAKRFDPDLLHVLCFGPNGIYAWALSRVRRLPLVVGLQGETMMDNDDIYDHSVILRAGLRRALADAKAVTACSRFTLADAEARFGLAPGSGHVVFNGVDLAGEATPAGAAGGQHPRQILALGRVVEKKGFDLLLRAFHVVADRHPDVCLVIGGEGPVLGDLRQLAIDLGVGDRVQFTGRLSRDEVAAAMRRADVFVMPSRLEPFGIVVLEGWRAGAAVVATSRGGPPEFVSDGEDGLLVDPFDTPALAGALGRLLEDEGLRRRIAEAGRRRVEDFSWPDVTDRYRDLYREVVGRDLVGQTSH